MNPYCSLNLQMVTIEQNDKPIFFTDIVGNACPSLLYVAIPYLFAFKRGIQFPWEKEHYKVRVLCPAGHVNFEIHAMPNDKFRITILYNDGNCRKHATNSTIEIPLQEEKMQSFNDVFPFLFHNSKDAIISLNRNVAINKVKDVLARPPREINACDIQSELDNPGVLVSVEGMKRSCAYHRKGKTFCNEQLAPPGLCLMAYHAIYPAFLSMLYGKNSPSSISVSCHGSNSKAEIVLERKARTIKPFLDVIERLLSYTPIRLDIIKYRVTSKVKSVHGSCIKHMRKGASYALGKKGLLCPSSFYSLFPTLVFKSECQDQRGCTCTCTSVPCHVTYKIRALSKD